MALYTPELVAIHQRAWNIEMTRQQEAGEPVSHIKATRAALDAVLPAYAATLRQSADSGRVGDEAPIVQQLRGRAQFLRDKGRVKSPQLMEQAANELAAHLTQPAQAVDVGAIEAVIRELCKWPKEETFYDDRATRLACAEKLRARSTAQAEVRGVDGWTARRDDELRLWRVYSPSGDVAGVYDQAAGVHAEVLRQLAQSLPATPPQPEE